MAIYRCIGRGVTNSSGVATLNRSCDGTQSYNYGYKGQGRGLVNFVASAENPSAINSSSDVSNTYPVWDTLFYDDARDGHQNSNWTSSGSPTVTANENGTLISNTASSIYTASATLTGDFEATLYVQDIVRGVRVGLNSSNGSTRSTIYNTGYVKIQRISNVPKIYFSSDGSTWTETTYDLDTLTSADCNFFFFLYTSGGNEVAIRFRDLKIYHI